MLRQITRTLALALALLFLAPAVHAATTPVNQWDIFEVSLPGPSDGEPFVDVTLSATFTQGDRSITAPGFYDGDGVYRVRFMPTTKGSWHYVTKSNRDQLNGKTGDFQVDAPGKDNLGPVRVAGMYNFAYADGSEFVPISTTLYGWAFQRSKELQQETLDTLVKSPFNRVRMMVLPIAFNADNAPTWLPFEAGKDLGKWNLKRFDPHYFQNIEQRIGDLRDRGIEAELILFHNRDSGHTLLDRMPADADDRYVRYCIARFWAYRNVWWNLANEFDSLRFKKDTDWDRFFEILQNEDPGQHPRSVHQMHRYYDFFKPWVTYMSIQYGHGVAATGRPQDFRNLARKPIIFDEIEYEGDVPQGWGHMSAEEMTARFWIGMLGGVYVTHGETYSNAPGVAWISRGGKLVGLSPARIAFLKQILESLPSEGLNPIEGPDEITAVAGRPGGYYLVYFANTSPTDFHWKALAPAPIGTNFHIDLIDTWNMTITPIDKPAVVETGVVWKPTRPPGVAAVVSTQPTTAATQRRPTPRLPIDLQLPGKPYMALRITRESQ
jgi:hypothetical protein